jgi:hypothetical protein
MTLAYHKRSQRGTTTIELLVSFTLLTAVLGAALPLVVRHGRILTSARQYRMALDELSNRAEEIASLDREQAIRVVEDMKPSAFTSEHLPGAELTAVLAPPDDAERVTLSLIWDEPGPRSAPVSLVAWLPPPASAEQATSTEESP